MTFVIYALVIIGLILIGPYFTICALNTLFPALVIPFNVWTWLSVVWLGMVLVADTGKK